ncbi:UNVERIFIED_CONTAM: hypothetical protein Sradi_3973400 [Sesamum radiatum]|uniref:Uncharacterized protein n=1 Tax=Sesamum radiatum TaxID=300843 RepID=A0AAW2PGI2_SESRA
MSLWSAVNTIIKYLKRTNDMFLIYGGGELILEGYNDTGFQSDDEDAKSQSGYVFKCNGGVVAWKSSKQTTKEAIWMKNYIQELGVVPTIAEPIVNFCDNTSKGIEIASSIQVYS